LIAQNSFKMTWEILLFQFQMGIIFSLTRGQLQTRIILKRFIRVIGKNNG
jgi:hypothetical protein